MFIGAIIQCTNTSGSGLIQKGNFINVSRDREREKRWRRSEDSEGEGQNVKRNRKLEKEGVDKKEDRKEKWGSVNFWKVSSKSLF